MPSPVDALALWRLRALRTAPREVRDWLVRASRRGPLASRLWPAAAVLLGLTALGVHSLIAAMAAHMLLWDEPPESLDDVATDLRDGHAGPYVLGLIAASLLVLIELLIVRVLWLRLRARYAGSGCRRRRPLYRRLAAPPLRGGLSLARSTSAPTSRNSPCAAATCVSAPRL